MKLTFIQDRTPFPLINTIEFKVKDEDNKDLTLQTYEYPAKGETKGVIFYIQGLGLSSLNEGYTFTPLVEQGFSVFAFDRRGIGYSEGLRGAVGPQLFED